MKVCTYTHAFLLEIELGAGFWVSGCAYVQI